MKIQHAQEMSKQLSQARWEQTRIKQKEFLTLVSVGLVRKWRLLASWVFRLPQLGLIVISVRDVAFGGYHCEMCFF